MKKTNYINYLYYVLLFFNVFLALNCLTVGLNVTQSFHLVMIGSIFSILFSIVISIAQFILLRENDSFGRLKVDILNFYLLGGIYGIVYFYEYTLYKESYALYILIIHVAICLCLLIFDLIKYNLGEENIYKNHKLILISSICVNVISAVLYCLQFINVNMTVSIVSTIIIALFGILEIICILKKKFNLLKSLYIIQLFLIPLIVIGHAFYNTTEFGLILFIWIVIKIVIEIFMLKFNKITE